jgi:PAS domain S-box-containing protein
MDYKSYRVLIVDTNHADRRLARLVLSHELPEINIIDVETATEFAEVLAQEKFDVVIAASSLSWAEGKEVVRVLRATRAYCPIILFTSGHDQLVACVDFDPVYGADDYVPKSATGYLCLPGAVRRQLEHRLTNETPASGFLFRLPVGVFSMNKEGRIVFANGAARRLFKGGDFKVTGDMLATFFSDTSVRAAIRRAVMSRREICDLNARLFCSDGRERLVRLWLWSSKDDQEVAFEGLLEDVSDLTRALRKLIDDVSDLTSVVDKKLSVLQQLQMSGAGVGNNSGANTRPKNQCEPIRLVTHFPKSQRHVSPTPDQDRRDPAHRG